MRPLGSLLLLGLLSTAAPVSSPETEVPRLVAEWDQATMGHSALAFSPCGRLLAQGGYDRKIRIWEVGPL